MSDTFNHACDAFDRAYNGEVDEIYYSSPPKKYITCKFCGENKLTWGKLGFKWRLFDKNDNVHICKKYKGI